MCLFAAQEHTILKTVLPSSLGVPDDPLLVCYLTNLCITQLCVTARCLVPVLDSVGLTLISADLYRPGSIHSGQKGMPL